MEEVTLYFDNDYQGDTKAGTKGNFKKNVKKNTKGNACIELSDPHLHILLRGHESPIDVCQLPFPVKILKNHLPLGTKSINIKIHRKEGKPPATITNLEMVAIQVAGDIRRWSQSLTEMWKSSKEVKNESPEERIERIDSFIYGSEDVAVFLKNNWKEFIEGKILRRGLLATKQLPDILTLTHLTDNLFSVSYSIPQLNERLLEDRYPKKWLLDVCHPWLPHETKDIAGLGYAKNPFVAIAEGDGSSERWNEIREFFRIFNLKNTWDEKFHTPYLSIYRHAKICEVNRSIFKNSERWKALLSTGLTQKSGTHDEYAFLWNDLLSLIKPLYKRRNKPTPSLNELKEFYRVH